MAWFYLFVAVSAAFVVTGFFRGWFKGVGANIEADAKQEIDKELTKK